MKKTISVLIPTYNREKELYQSIKTVIDQTYKGNIEIVIIDDSKESLKENIEKNFSRLLKKKGNIKINYIHKAKKEGSPLARNIGIEKSKGEYIAFLDDDDLWLPEKLEKQAKILDENEKVALVVCNSLDKRFGRERISRPLKMVSHELILKSFNLSSSSTYLIRKSAIEKVGGFDISLPSAQEYDLAIRISKIKDVKCVDEVLMIQNATDGQISENWNKKIRGLLSVYNKHKKDYNSVSIFNTIKLVGILGLYMTGFLIGNKIYGVIIPFKERYEER